jgi:hypothetical protein
MAFFAARVHEQSSALLAAQEAAAANARASQGAVVDAFESVQSRTIASVERLLDERAAEKREAEARERDRLRREKEARGRQREARERAFQDREKQARTRGRLARVLAVVGFVLMVGGAWAFFALDEQQKSVARDTEERADRALEALVERAAVAPVASRAASTTLPAGFAK